MKKKVLGTILLFFIAFSANAETYKNIFNYANKRTNINFLFGCNGYNTDIALQEIGENNFVFLHQEKKQKSNIVQITI